MKKLSYLFLPSTLIRNEVMCDGVLRLIFERIQSIMGWLPGSVGFDSYPGSFSKFLQGERLLFLFGNERSRRSSGARKTSKALESEQLYSNHQLSFVFGRSGRGRKKSLSFSHFRFHFRFKDEYRVGAHVAERLRMKTKQWQQCEMNPTSRI